MRVTNEMAKKSKPPQANMKNDVASNSGSGSGSGSSDIFTTIFGDIPQEEASISIFSQNNPFRRKPSDCSQTPQQLGLGFGSAEAIENPKNGDSEKNDLVELKKRKRNKEKKHSVDSDSIEEASETPLVTKKPKKEKVKKTDFGFEANRVSKEDEGENPNLGSESKVKSKKDKGKNPNLGSESKGVSKKDEGRNPDLGLELNGMSKKKEGKNPNLGFELNEMSNKGKGKNPDSGFESKGMSEKGEGQNPKLGVESNNTLNLEIERKKGDDKVKEKKKKRKREELEREYEAKHYGVVAEAEAEGGERGVGGIVVGEKRKSVDNPADMLVSKEGFDNESKLLRTVFVGNLPLKVKKKALLKEFSQFGDIESVRIRSVPIMDTKTPRKGAIMKKQINDSVDSVHAYIVFKTEQSAQASLAHNLTVVGGNHIRVDRACPPRKKLKGENAPLYDNKRTVFVGNLPFDVKDEEIYQLFCGINQLESSIEAVRVVRDPHSSVGKGIAYVLFKTRDAANSVVKKRNLKLRDRDLRVSHARSDSTPSKRKNPSSEWTGNSPAKKLALGSRTPSGSNSRVQTKSATSYQGLRASKSGVQKKAHRKTTEPVKLKSKTQKEEKLKVRSTKRPSVAARKANALKGGGGGASKLAGKKRKMESQTPESSHRNKKAKKFR